MGCCQWNPLGTESNIELLIIDNKTIQEEQQDCFFDVKLFSRSAIEDTDYSKNNNEDYLNSQKEIKFIEKAFLNNSCNFVISPSKKFTAYLQAKAQISLRNAQKSKEK